MYGLIGRIFSTLFLVLSLLTGQQARAELIATSGETKIVHIKPLRNGLSALTLAWTIDHPTIDRVAALDAGLSSVITGGTSHRSPYEIDNWRQLKGVRQSVHVSGQNLMLTVSAPHDVFPETLLYVESQLLRSEYSDDWYARELQKTKATDFLKTRRSSDIMKQVIDFLMFEPNDTADVAIDGAFRFGRPAQVILRSGDEDVKRRTERIVLNLPNAEPVWESSFLKWAEALFGAEKKPFALPNGIVHFSDQSSTEMLILFVKAEKFLEEGHQIGANVLVDYIGADFGSEMFRIIRQEMRASYNPQSGFVATDKNKAVIFLSATVEAAKWPEVYEKISDIYRKTRSGKVDQDGLKIQHGKLRNVYFSDFFREPAWAALQYLYEYPNGTEGTFSLPIFKAFGTESPAEIAANAQTYLPPLDDFLVVLVGGGEAPTDTLKSQGYCALPKNTPLRRCLDVLSNTQN